VRLMVLGTAGVTVRLMVLGTAGVTVRLIGLVSFIEVV